MLTLLLLLLYYSFTYMLLQPCLQTIKSSQAYLQTVLVISIVEGLSGCAVGAHDCQESRVGRARVRVKE
jgi:hypothetical protein